MRTLYFFWYQLNWLEFVTYIVIPTSIVLMVLVYVYFNISLLRKSSKLTLDYRFKVMEEIYDLEINLSKEKKDDKILEENKKVDNKWIDDEKKMDNTQNEDNLKVADN